MTHLTGEELERWWEGGRPGYRKRIVAHLAACDECGALYGDVIDLRPVADSDVSAAIAGVMAAGYRAYRRSSAAPDRCCRRRARQCRAGETAKV